jgi:hypothetical protein
LISSSEDIERKTVMLKKKGVYIVDLLIDSFPLLDIERKTVMLKKKGVYTVD